MNTRTREDQDMSCSSCSSDKTPSAVESVRNLLAFLVTSAPDYSSIRDDDWSILGDAMVSTETLVSFLQNTKRCVFQSRGDARCRDDGKIDVLNLAGFSLESVSEEVGERLRECVDVGEVQRLYLSGNALRSNCVEDIFRICSKHVLELFLDSNVLKTVPWDTLVSCDVVLTHLDLSKNRISRLGCDAVSDGMVCSRLEWVDLSGNSRLEELPETGFFSTLPNLKRLDLHSCMLARLPKDICCVKDTLEHLSLHSNCFVELPDEITECTQLTWMSLNSNALERLPQSMGNLVNLQRLSLHINKLNEIPESLSHCIHIEALSLHSNDLRSIPDSIGCLKECVRLSLHHNPSLGCIPDGICEMSQLKELWMYDCGIEHINPKIGRLKNLQKLWLDRNPFDVNGDVPWESLKQLEMLQELYLDAHLDTGETSKFHDNKDITELKEALKHLKTLSV